MTRALISALQDAAPRLTQRCMDEMYRDPFWMERYGMRGRTHANTDGDFHIKYVVSALEATDSTLFVTYGRWLRDLLVARGMCSRHLAENFTLLAAAIRDEAWPDGAAAIAILDAGAAGLTYTTGDAAIVDQHRPAWSAQLGEHADHVLSYIADALVLKQASHLDGYLQFLGRRIPVAELVARIAALPALPAAAQRFLEAP